MLTADDMLKFLTGQLEDKEIEYFKHHPEELIRKLDGATVEATVLFCDIVGFTKFSENHDLQKIRILLKTTLPAIAEEIRLACMCMRFIHMYKISQDCSKP